MTEPLIREDVPSSGERTCEHVWKRVMNESGPNGEWVLMCEKCGSTKIVLAPKKDESGGKSEKPLLME